MLKTDKAIVVEGKYDKIRLSGVIDGTIICTDGFGVFKNSEKLELLRHYARTTGIIIITDSDRAGFAIRSYIKGCLDENADIINVYIPDIFGKERRKEKPSKEGKLGVEGMKNDLLEELLKKALQGQDGERRRDIDKTFLFELGLTGGANSSELRMKLLKHLGLPARLTTNAMADMLNTMMTREELAELMDTQILD